MKAGIIYGRFQPPHWGHFVTIQKIISDEIYDIPVILVRDRPIGNHNPFPSKDMADLLIQILTEEMKHNTWYVIRGHVSDFYPEYTSDGLNAKLELNGKEITDIEFIGGNKKLNKAIQNNELKVRYQKPIMKINATQLRKIWRAGEEINGCWIPPQTKKYLEEHPYVPA